MCVCVHVYVCTCVYVYMCTCVYVCMCMCVYVCMCVCICVYADRISNLNRSSFFAANMQSQLGVKYVSRV